MIYYGLGFIHKSIMNRYILLDLAYDFNRYPKLYIISNGTLLIGDNYSELYNISTGTVSYSQTNMMASEGSSIGNDCSTGIKEPWIPIRDNTNNSMVLGGKDVHLGRFDTQCVLSATTRRFSNLSHYAASEILEQGWTPNSLLNGRMFLRADNGIYLEVNGEPNRFIDVTTEIIELKEQVKHLTKIVTKLDEKVGWI